MTNSIFNIRAEEIHIVLDLTPNFVKESDDLFQSAIIDNPVEENLNAFVHAKASNNWVKFNGTLPAWKKVKTTYFLSQFGDNIDLNMNSSVAQQKLIDVIKQLAEFGVKGFRFNNAKHFLVDMGLKNEDHSSDRPTAHVVGEYGFYNHHQTTYRDGLGDVLHIFSRAVFNATEGEGLLTIRDDVSSHLEKFKVKNSTIELSIPRLDFINHYLKPKAENARFLYEGFNVVAKELSDLQNLWMQVDYDEKDSQEIGASTYNVFTSLLPGVQITSLSSLKFDNSTFIKLQELRDSPVFQQGNFNFTLSANSTAFGYTL
jgi:Alpha amylase, catalytic domain